MSDVDYLAMHVVETVLVEFSEHVVNRVLQILCTCERYQQRVVQLHLVASGEGGGWGGNIDMGKYFSGYLVPSKEGGRIGRG